MSCKGALCKKACWRAGPRYYDWIGARLTMLAMSDFDTPISAAVVHRLPTAPPAGSVAVSDRF